MFLCRRIMFTSNIFTLLYLPSSSCFSLFTENFHESKNNTLETFAAIVVHLEIYFCLFAPLFYCSISHSLMFSHRITAQEKRKHFLNYFGTIETVSKYYVFLNMKMKILLFTNHKIFI